MVPNATGIIVCTIYVILLVSMQQPARFMPTIHTGLPLL